MKLVIFHEFCPELEVLWRKLELTSHPHVFQTYEWLRFGQQTVGSNDLKVKPFIVVVMDAGDCPRVIFPLGVRRWMGAKVLEFLGGWYGDYLGPLIDASWVTDVDRIRSAWKLVSKELPSYDVRHFIKMPAKWGASGNPVLKVWKVVFQSNSYAASLPENIDSFRSRLRSKFKADTKRQRRRLSAIGELTFDVIDGFDGVRSKALDVMIEQKRKRCHSMGIPDIFSSQAIQGFYRNLSEKLGDGGRVHFSILRQGDNILAAHWGATYRDRFYYLMPTFTSEELGVYSPGRLLLENLVEWSIQSKLKIFDFTIGGEEYKKDWCDQEMPLFEHIRTVTPLGLPYLLYICLRRYARRSERIWGGIKFLYSWFQYGRQRKK
jgi:CelD/BcsL family acetyltransferase involved in cellulose biosynthesis